MKLKLAIDLSLPLDAVTQTFLIVGKRGSGKSNTAARFVEQLHHARIPFVVLDPVDTWWGLKAGRDGEKGLDVYVFGGRKADLPLEAGGGALIAEVLCEHRMPMVLSVKHLSGKERSAFMVAFARTLFQKWSGGPLHVVLEEAHELAPQMGARGGGDDGEAAMLGAFKRLWKLGRASGIGGTAVTQRPASLSKDITTQSEILIAHRTIGPQDVKAIGEWVKYHGERLDILAELPTLPTGEAFVWAPEFPEGKPIGLTRTAILLRETYDSASTPKVGEQRVEPKELAAVDLERLRVKMAATIEKAKQDDPRELRKQLAVLKAELAKKDAVLAEVDVRTKRIDEKLSKAGTTKREAARTEQITELRQQLAQHRRALEEAMKILVKVKAVDFSARGGEALEQAVTAAIKQITAGIEKRVTALSERVTGIQASAAAAETAIAALLNEKIDLTVTVQKHAPFTVQPATAARPMRAVAADRGSSVHDGVTKAEQRVLDGVAWWHAANISEPTRLQVAMVARYTVNGHFNNLVGGLRTKGLVDYPGNGGVMLTEDGRKAANQPAGELTRAELIARVMQVLRTEPYQRIFGAVVDAGRDLTREELARLTGYTVNGHFNNMVGSLRSLGVIDYPSKGGVTLGEMFEALA